ncbi:ribonuclease H-like domain-containing protein [Fundidesulfovibrio putealis]|uniref:ribonuclease H-like domain-containing protein n=1 Tax=Fundidesulfovibrio putealis TaxID=270496 RepID=UPI0003F5F516|nr:ribonuclease H-like domain-containing protein [Fundidesulfovibrio putealis]
MLGHCFCHLPGVGPKSESSLWDAGIHTWEDFLCAASPPVSAAKAASMRPGLEASREALEAGEADWFAARLRTANSWRLFPHFLPHAGYLDIETDGERDPVVTAVALYHQGRVTTYVHGRNMADLEEDLARVKVLVTFNGKCFDVPIIERVLGMRCPKAHVDLRFVLKSLGVSGGLKACEKRFGLSRRELDGVDGWSAVLLWREFERSRSENVLETLLAYNVADVLSLEVLMAHALDELLLTTPFAARKSVAIPSMAENPFAADPDVVEMVRGVVQRPFY